jgi:rhamnogalacturonyl hydrolase YesR
LSKNQYLPIAIKTANWLDQHVVKTDHGITWDISQSFKGPWRYYDEASMYAGASGIVKFYLELAQISGNQRYLDTAVAAGHELAARALASQSAAGQSF